MTDKAQWNWDLGKRDIAPLGQWHQTYEWVEEPCVSPDGETLAAVVNTGDLAFTVCTNKGCWEATYDKVWNLKFSAQGVLTGLASEMAQWSLVVDGQPWPEAFEYVWDVKLPENGSGPIACAAKNGVDYFAVVNGKPWDKVYSNISDLVATSRTAAVVQTVSFNEGDIETFQKGCYTVAVDGIPWEQNFINAWDVDITEDGKSVAAGVRLSLYEYTVAVDGVPWEGRYSSVWEPKFSPLDGSVLAPVKVKGGWTLAKDNQLIWQRRYTQLWHPDFSNDGGHIAAVVASKFGQWTVAVDDVPWKLTFGDWVGDLSFSPDGKRVVCIGAQRETQQVVVDGTAWSHHFNRIWPPVFSPDSQHIAAKVEKEGCYFLVVDDKPYLESYDWMAPPVFNPEGDKLMLRVISGSGGSAVYRRLVIPLTDILQ